MQQKKILTTLVFLSWTLICFSQTDLLSNFNFQRLQKQKNGMLILGGWAVGNIAIGSIMMGNRSGEDRYFHQMNAAWNTINLGIATLGYFSAMKAEPAGFSLYQSIQEQYQLQKILLLNTGLDVGYVIGGLYLIERSKTAENKPDRLKGFGRSIIIQGSFLLVFDLVNYFLHAKDNKQIQHILEGLSLSPGQIGWYGHF